MLEDFTRDTTAGVLCVGFSAISNSPRPRLPTGGLRREPPVGADPPHPAGRGKRTDFISVKDSSISFAEKGAGVAVVILYTVQFRLYRREFMLYSVQLMLYTAAQFILYTVHFTL